MGGGGEAFKEGFRSLIFADVGLDGIGEGRDVGEVGDPIVLLVSDREGDRFVMPCHRPDDGIHIFSDQVYVVVSLGVVLFVAEYRFAEGDGAVDL